VGWGVEAVLDDLNGTVCLVAAKALPATGRAAITTAQREAGGREEKRKKKKG